MNGKSLIDDIKYGNVATENCRDVVMKTLFFFKKGDRGKEP